MKLVGFTTMLGLITPAILQSQLYPLWYDTLYDGVQTSVNSVACSTDLLTRGLTTFSQIHTWPSIGGIPTIDGPNSSNCGTCWQLSYTNDNGQTTSIYFTAIDTGLSNGFSISMESLDFLTNGLSQTYDGLTVNVVQLFNNECQL